MFLERADKVFNPIVFQAIMVLSVGVMQIHLLHYAYGRYLKFALAFGVLICIWQLIRGRLLMALKDKASIAALCFVLLYTVTIVINRNAFFETNLKQLAYMLVFFILLFSVFKDSNDIVCISTLILILTFVLSCVSLLTYVLNINEWYVADGEFFVGTMSLSTTRFWGLYNPNVCGTVASISIIISLYLLKASYYKSALTKVFVSVFILVNMTIQFLVLILSESRGAYYGLVVSVAVTTFILIVKNYKREKTSLLSRTVFALTFCILLIVVIFGISFFVQKNVHKICIVSTEDSSNVELDTNLENAIEDIIRKYSTDSSALAGVFHSKTLSLTDSFATTVNRDNSKTTGRILIWEAGFRVFLERPVFGWTNEGLVEPVNEYAYYRPDGSYTFKSESVISGGLHNIYLTVLCSSGVLGFVNFLFIIGIVLIRFLKLVSLHKTIDKETLFSFAMCLYFLLSELVESRILFTVSFCNVVFWLYFGYLNYYSLKGIESVDSKN